MSNVNNNKEKIVEEIIESSKQASFARTKKYYYYTLIPIFIGIVWLIYSFTQVNNFNTKISNLSDSLNRIDKKLNAKTKELNEVELQRVQKVNEIKVLGDSLLVLIMRIKDANTRKKGENLAVKLGIEKSDDFKVVSSNVNNVDSAQKFENLGYESLLSKDINASIDMFGKSENYYNGFHQVYDIVRYLVKNKTSLLNKNDKNWEDTYRTILLQFSWKMPENYKKMLASQILKIKDNG